MFGTGKSFGSAESSDAQSTSSASASNNPNPSTSTTTASHIENVTQTTSAVLRSIENVTADPATFTFTVPWGQMPKETMTKLNNAKEKKEKANPADIEALKLAIAKKLKSAYESHKEVYPGQQKHPGRKVYESVTSQVRN